VIEASRNFFKTVVRRVVTLKLKIPWGGWTR